MYIYYTYVVYMCTCTHTFVYMQFLHYFRFHFLIMMQMEQLYTSIVVHIIAAFFFKYCSYKMASGDSRRFFSRSRESNRRGNILIYTLPLSSQSSYADPSLFARLKKGGQGSSEPRTTFVSVMNVLSEGRVWMQRIASFIWKFHYLAKNG